MVARPLDAHTDPLPKRARVLNESDNDLEQAAVTNGDLGRIATRFPVGTTCGVGAVVRKNGMRTLRYRAGQLEQTLLVGGACSEVFSGPLLAKVLQPAVDHQVRALEDLRASQACSPLSIHTSAGVPAALGPFLEALAPHLPWPQTDDWFVNLQLEGTTAVWAGVEALMRLSEVNASSSGPPRRYVAVAERSYHGPKTTGLGQPAEARWPGAPRTEGQISYPLPSPAAAKCPEEQVSFLQRFDAFLAEHGDRTGVIIFEPQWGSSFAARPWPRGLLQEAVRRSRARGLLVLCDEIMCGLGRHGQGTLFLSRAWKLDPDAVTFGKAVAGGAFPLAGIAVQRGAEALNRAGVKLAQSHTYAGSSALALLTAREVLRELPAWFQHAADMGRVVEEVLGPCRKEGFLEVQGQGLMWGGLFTDGDAERRRRAAELLTQACSTRGVWPYFVPDGRFMLTPPMDIAEEDLREALQKLACCVQEVKDLVDC
uniref:Uncharacterized protein n=1 Tax=Alexandrium monilatum TaxID=311494 RepID=A0A7S4RHR7_9DINO|mmetsp:Transcript_18067/g.54471  ORF Transcript_18067/g.54471 Transcript_18067/m.54471 type:complete len:483 (+) Transcript_18067:76-1524(+)